MLSGRDPVAFQDGLASTCRGDDDVEPVRRLLRPRYRHDLDAALTAHFRGEVLSSLFVRAEDADVPDRPHLANGDELRARLLPTAEDADRRAILAREVLRR